MSKIILIDDGNYAQRIEKLLLGGVNNVERLNSAKVLLHEIMSKKPQFILFPYKLRNSKYIRKMHSRYSFIPMAVYGEFGTNLKKNNSRMQRLLKEGYSACFPVDVILSADSFVSGINQILWKSLAKEEIWDEQLKVSKTEFRLNIYRKILAFAVTSCIFVLFGFAVKNKYLKINEYLPRAYRVPYSNISGLAFSKDSLWTTDWMTQTIYKHSLKENFKIEQIYPFPEMRFSGITLAEGYLWTLDSWQRKIRQHTFDNNLTVLKEFNTPGTNPTGITFDGRYILTCDNALGKMYVYRMDEQLSVIQEYSLPETNPIGIFADGKYIWIADSLSNKIYCYTMNDFELDLKSIFIPPEYDNFSLSGISGDADYIWLLSDKTSKIFRYPKKYLEVVEQR